jgi:hypothetical protein
MADEAERIAADAGIEWSRERGQDLHEAVATFIKCQNGKHFNDPGIRLRFEVIWLIERQEDGHPFQSP